MKPTRATTLWRRAMSVRWRTLPSYGLLGLALVLLLFPIYWMFLTATLHDDRLLQYPPVFLPAPSSLFLHPFARIFVNRPVFQWLLNSAYVSTLTTVISLSISALGGYALSRIKTPESQVMGGMLLLVRMLPGTLLIVPLYMVFHRLHLIDNLVTLVIANTSYIIPFGVWMMKGFFDGIPREIEESAQVDGCTILGAFVRVTLPLSRPGLVATAMYCFVFAWGELLFARTLINSAQNGTITAGVTTYIGDTTISWNDMMAASLLACLPVLVIFLFLEKHLVRGLVAGSIK
jgi:multiple sugar transport system permease protein